MPSFLLANSPTIGPTAQTLDYTTPYFYYTILHYPLQYYTTLHYTKLHSIIVNEKRITIMPHTSPDYTLFQCVHF